jgi:competence protein ComEA
MLFSFTAVGVAKEDGKIDINSASVEELAQLKGIGQTYAERVIEYREKNGPFQKPEDLLKVKGIGPKIYDSNRDVIVVE